MLVVVLIVLKLIDHFSMSLMLLFMFMLFATFGGKYLVRGGHATQLEGQAQGERNVVIEFPSREIAEAWYNSDAYQAIIAHRTNNSTGALALVDGYDL